MILEKKEASDFLQTSSVMEFKLEEPCKMYLLALLGIFFISSASFAMQEPAKDATKEVILNAKALKKKQLTDMSESSDDSSGSSSETSNGLEDSSGDAHEVAVLCETDESVDIGTDNDLVPATASWARMQKYLADRKALEESSRVTPEVVVPVISMQTNSTIAVSPTADLFLKGEEVLKPHAKNPYGPAPLRALERLTQGLDVQPAAYGGQAISHYKHVKAEFENYQQARNFEVAKIIEGYQKNLDQFISVQNVFDSNHSLECTIVDLSQKKALWSQKNQEAIIQKNNLVARIYSLGGVGDDDAALVLQDLAKSELELAKINDALFVAHASLKANQATLTKMYDQQLGGIEKALESYDGEKLQMTLTGYKNILTGHAQFRVGLLGRIKAYQSALREDVQKSQSKLYSINPFAESRDELNARIGLAQRDLRAAHAALAQLEYEDAYITPVIVKNIEEQIVSKRTVAALGDCMPHDTQFHKVLEDMRISGDSSFMQSYSLNQNAKTQLEQLGVDLHKDIALEYTGNRVQHYIQHKLIESLNTMGSIQLTEHTKPLLNFAVSCNIQGQVLNKENKVAQALYAWQASDSIAQYAATVADYVIAAGEGALGGLQSTAFTIAHIGRTSLDAVVSPEVYTPIMREKFNKAVLLVSKFVNALNEDIALLAQGDDASLIKLSQKNINRDKAMRDFAQGLATQWHSMSRRDRVKALSKFFTEWECFGAVGRIFGEYFELSKIAEAAEAAGNAVQKNPHQALIAEVVNTTAEVFDKDPKLIEKVLEFAQSDTEFLSTISKEENAAKEISRFVENLEKNGTRYQTLDSYGKYRRIRPSSGIEAWEVWAPKKYDEIRNLADDITIISRNTNIAEFKIKRIKNHLFYDESHILDNGIKGRLAPDPEIAASWDRLYRGDFIKNDLDLLEHEYFESKFEKSFGTTLRIAHDAAKDSGRIWQPPQ